MARANFTFSSFQIQPSVNRKTLDSIPSLPPLKLTKRKNYLRRKLLKTLTEHYHPPILPQQNQTPQEQQQNVSETLNFHQVEEELEEIGGFYQSPVLEEEEDERNYEKKEFTSEIRVSESPAIVSTRSITELVFYLGGIFVLQTVFSVWIFGYSNFDKKSRNEENEVDLGTLGFEMVNDKQKGGNFVSKLMGDVNFKTNGLINVDNSELEEEIIKIRVMAREVRELEAKLNKSELSSSTDVIRVDGEEKVLKSASSRGKTNIQKEVDVRLTKLEKRLSSIREKSTALPVTYLQNLSKIEEKKVSENINGEVKDEKFMSKKKKRFRSYPKNTNNHSKGFTGGKDASLASTITGSSLLNFSAQKEEEGIQTSSSDLGELRATHEEDSHGLTDDDDDARNESFSLLEGEEAERESAGGEPMRMRSSEKGVGMRSSEKGVGMRSSNRKPRSGSIKDTSERSLERGRSRELRANISHKYGEDVGSIPRSKDDLWWMKLPYVLAILLRRDPGEEAAKGLYTLKMDEEASSYTVAFEDRGDAANFSYILESFFDDLGDVSADVVPLSIAEIKEAEKSGTMKLIVVRKGELRLYAGQPLGEVETALRSIWESQFKQEDRRRS